MSVDMQNEGTAFSGLPNTQYRLRWEIWQNGVRQIFQSWSPNAVLKFSVVRKKYGGNAEIIIRMLSNDGYIEQAMLKVFNKDVEKIEYHHLLNASFGNIFAGMRVKTSTGIWNCCVDGSVFMELT